MKRAIAVIMCAVMIITLLAVSTVPVAAFSPSSAYKYDSFTVSGATVTYLVRGYVDSSGYLYGNTAASLQSDFWTTATLHIGAGVSWNSPAGWIAPAQMLGKKDLHARNSLVSDQVYSPYKQNKTYNDRNFAAYDRLLLETYLWPLNVSSRGWDSRCYTWKYGDSQMTRDPNAEYDLKNYAQSVSFIKMLEVLYTLSHFFG